MQLSKDISKDSAIWSHLESAEIRDICSVHKRIGMSNFGGFWVTATHNNILVHLCCMNPIHLLCHSVYLNQKQYFIHHQPHLPTAHDIFSNLKGNMLYWVINDFSLSWNSAFCQTISVWQVKWLLEFESAPEKSNMTLFLFSVCSVYCFIVFVNQLSVAGPLFLPKGFPHPNVPPCQLLGTRLRHAHDPSFRCSIAYLSKVPNLS